MTFPRTSARHQLLFHHEVLHALLRRLADAAERSAQGKGSAQELRDAARSLHLVMEAHAAREERLLEPVLSRKSPQRLEELRRGHRRALEMLRALGARPLAEAAAGYRQAVPVLVAAIEREGREILESAQPPAHRADATWTTA